MRAGCGHATSCAASSEPEATPTAKNRLIAVSTLTPPPTRALTMTGASDSVSAPTVQNQLTARQPTHCLSLARNSRRMSRVAVIGFQLMRRPGAPMAVEGM